MIQVLMVDDDPVVIDVTKAFLEKSGDMQILGITSATKALEKLEASSFDAIVSDYEMPVMDGIAFLKAVRALNNDIPFIIFTGRSREDVVIEALNSGADYYLQKYMDTLSQFAELEHQIRQGVGRKKLADRLQKSEEMYRTIFESTGTAMAIAEEDGTVYLINSEMEDLSGYSRDEIEGKKNLTELVAKEDLSKLKEIQHLRQIDPNLAPKKFEFKLLDRYNNVKDVLAYVTTVPGTKKSLISIVDITERKLMEENLLFERQKFQTYADCAPFGIVIIEEDGDFGYINPKFIDLFGYHPKDIPSGREWFKRAYPDPEYRRQVTAAWIEDLESSPQGEKRPRTFSVTCKDGSEKIINFIGVQLEDGKNLLSCEDITEKNRAEEELRNAQNDLEERFRSRTSELLKKNREMERFIYAVSHDLMTPLVTISGFLSFLKKDIMKGDFESIESDFKTLDDVVVKMGDLLNDTLELSRIGRVVTAPAKVPLAEIVQEALNQMSGKLISRDIEVCVADDLPFVNVDRSRIVQVFVNLIDNSIKYANEKSQPKIEVGLRADDEVTVFFVRDNGKGIDPSQHETVFDLFCKIDNNSDGCGAGLALVKKIIEVHGCRIWIESKEGQGCKVCFTLPLADGSSTAANLPNSSRLLKTRLI
jgi:PAS domain S-box-containing protein